MAATVTDKFKKYSDGSDAPNVARVASPRSAAGTTLACDDLTGWATDTAVNFATYELDTADEVVSSSITYWVGVVSGNNLTNVARVKGAADGGNAINDVVVQIPDSDRFDDLVDGLLVSLDQDGTLKAGAVDNAAALASNVVTTAKLADASVTSEKLNATVAFYATTTQSCANSALTTITTYSEVDDLGDDFNPTTGVFTAPYDGFYHIDVATGFTDMTSSADGRIIVDLLLNGSLLAEGMNTGQTTSQDPIAQLSISCSLTSGDELKLRVTNHTGGTENLSNSFFSGFLVGRT